MSNLETAIAGALDEHAKAERHVARWIDDLTLRINGAVIGHLSEKMFVSEGMRVRVASLASELANDFVEDALPRFLHEKTGAARMDGTVYANALTPDFLERVTAMHVKACLRALDPQIKKHIEGRDRHFATQPKVSDAGPSMGIDLGSHARQLAQINALHENAAYTDHRKAAVPEGAAEGFVTTPGHIEGERAAADAVKVKGPAPSTDRVRDALAKADTQIDLNGGGKYPAKKGKR